MAGLHIPFNDILHQYSNHKRFKLSKRQGREPLSQEPGAGTTTNETPTSLSLGRPSETPPPSDDEDITTTSEAITTTRTRTTTTPPISTPTSTTTEEDTDTTTTETSESSTSESSSAVSIITTTIESTSTSTSFSSEEETTTEPTATLPDTTTLPDTSTSLSTTARAILTSIVTASLSRSSTASNSLASSSSDSDSSDGPSAGTVVGIVAGALVGVVVLSGIVGYVFRTKCSNKNDEDDFDGENPFGNVDDTHGGAFGVGGAGHRSGASRSELRRDSQLLADEGDSIHQMSELGHGAGSYGNAAPIGAMGAGAAAAGAYALHRDNSTSNNSNLPGLQRNDTMNPRPPTMIQRHYAAQAQQQQMPSFQPGQIVYPSASMNQSGPYPSFPQSGNGVPVGGVFNSNQGQQQQQYPSNAMNDYQYGENDGYEGQQGQYPQRSGTPEYANPQQYFHQASDSFGSGVGVQSPFEDANASPARNNNILASQAQYAPQQQSQYGNGNGARYEEPLGMNASETLYSPAQGQTNRDAAMKGSDRARRTLSVRNGGAVNDDEAAPRDSVYGGM